MKVRPIVWKTALILLGCIILAAVIIFSFTFSLFLKPIQNWGWKPYVIIGIWFVLSIGLVIITFMFSYYEVFKKYVAVHRAGKTLIYYYSDVVYIDEVQYQKHKLIAFYTKQGHPRYLMGDKKDILFNTMQQNCKNRLSSEDFAIKYPKVKLL